MAAEFIFPRAEGLSSFKQETPWGAGWGRWGESVAAVFSGGFSF